MASSAGLAALLGFGCASARVGQATVTSGNLALVCEPKDAEVSVDGVPQGRCDDFDGRVRRLFVPAGMHRIDVRKDGFLPYWTYFEPAGARAKLTVQLQRTAPEGAQR